MDDIDRANQEAESLLAMQLWQASQEKERLVAKGSCWFCDEATPHRFCSPECRDDYAREQAAYQRNGKPAEDLLG